MSGFGKSSQLRKDQCVRNSSSVDFSETRMKHQMDPQLIDVIVSSGVKVSKSLRVICNTSNF